MIGWADPVNPNPKQAIKWLKSLQHDTYVYPENIFDHKRPPVCIFVPETHILNKMIETLAKSNCNLEVTMSKFSHYDQPKPQWMIEEDKKKQKLRMFELKQTELANVSE